MPRSAPTPSPSARAPRAGAPDAALQRAYGELAQAEDRFRAIVEASPTPLLISRLEDGAILYANGRLEALVGVEPGSLVGRATPDFYADPSDRERVLAAVRERGEVRDHELAIRRADGTELWVALTVQRLAFDGAPALATALLDITARKATERALRERTSELEAVFRGLPDLYFRMEADGTIVDYRAGRQFGLYVPPEAFLGRRAPDVLPPPVGAQTAVALAEVARTGAPVGFEYTLPLGDERRDFEARILPLDDAPDQVVAVVRDVTERTRAEGELRYQAALLEAQGEASLDGILVVAADGRILSSNRRFAELWGLPPAVLAAGSDAAALAAVLDRVEDPGAFQARVAHLYAHPDEVARDEVRLRDGCVLDRYSAPVRGGRGELYGRIWFFRDVTAETGHAAALEAARCEAEAARVRADRYAAGLEASLADLHRAQDRLVQQETLAALGRVAAGVAHELRNPLNFIVNFAELQGDLVRDLRAAVDAGDGAAALALADDLLANAERVLDHGRRAETIVARMQPRASTPGRRQRVDLNALVDAHARAHARGARLGVDLDPALEPFEVDPEAVGQAVGAVVRNAAEAAAAHAPVTGRPPEVRVQTRRLGAAVEVVVADNGPGLAPDVAPRLFEPFFTTKPPGEGTGLGLTAAYEAVLAHGGTIEAENDPAGGARFRIVLTAAGAALPLGASGGTA